MRVMAIRQEPAEDKSITVEIRGIASRKTITTFVIAPTNDGQWIVAEGEDLIGYRHQSARDAARAALKVHMYEPVWVAPRHPVAHRVG